MFYCNIHGNAKFSQKWKVIGEQAKQDRHYLEYTNLVWKFVCRNSSTCTVYLMWTELAHNHFNLRNIMQVAALFFET